MKRVSLDAKPLEKKTSLEHNKGSKPGGQTIVNQTQGKKHSNIKQLYKSLVYKNNPDKPSTSNYPDGTIEAKQHVGHSSRAKRHIFTIAHLVAKKYQAHNPVAQYPR